MTIVNLVKLDSAINGAQAHPAPKQPPAQKTTVDPTPSPDTSISRAEAQRAKEDVSKAVRAEVKKLNQELKAKNSKVSVTVDQSADRYVLRYKNAKSGKVVQQLPAEGVLKMIRDIRKENKGTIVNSLA
jgi:uncharacterized FlaG/YvyC family protein